MEGFKKMSELLGDQISHGSRLGFKHGGHVAQSNTSSQFLQKTKKQNSMDSGVQPANEGTTEQDKEAGGTPKLKPGYKKGGKAMMSKGAYRKKHGGSMKGYKKYMEGGLAASKEGISPRVKMRGGRMKKGGYNSEPMIGE